MRLGVSIAKIARAFTVLIDDAHGRLDHVLSHAGLIGRDLFQCRHRATMLPGKPRSADGPAEQADGEQDQQGFA